MRYIFVEGYDDNCFVKNFIGDLSEVKIIEFSRMKKDKLEAYIKSIKSMNEEYIVLSDLDQKDEKKKINELRKRAKNIEIEKVFFSIQEIEAWYIAGISDKLSKQYKVNQRDLLDTHSITKEKFEKMFENEKESLLQIKMKLLSDYDIERAKTRSESLKTFVEKVI